MDGDDGVEAIGRCCCGGEDGVVLLAGLFGLSLTGYDDECGFGYSCGVVDGADCVGADGLGGSEAVGFCEAQVGVGVDDGAFVSLCRLGARLKRCAQKGRDCGAEMFPCHPLGPRNDKFGCRQYVRFCRYEIEMQGVCRWIRNSASIGGGRKLPKRFVYVSA